MHSVARRAPVAQLDSASVFGTEGWGFESLRVYLTYVNSIRQWHGKWHGIQPRRKINVPR